MAARACGRITLILIGGSELGKTRLAYATAGYECKRTLQSEEGTEEHFGCGSIPTMAALWNKHSSVCAATIFDEIELQKQGSNAVTKNSLKLLLNTEDICDIHCKSSMLKMPAKVPRIWLMNCDKEVSDAFSALSDINDKGRCGGLQKLAQKSTDFSDKTVDVL